MTEKTLSRIGFEAYDKVLRIQIFGKDFDPEVIPVGEDVEAWDAAAQAIIDAHEARKWLPIETAEKIDGEDIYVLTVAAGIGEVHISTWDGYYGDGIFSDNRPTHWQPLPAPPKQGD